MDSLVFEEAISTEVDSSEFVSKKWLYINDSNAQNYSSQVVIDTTALSSSGGWQNYSEAFILFPIVVQLSSKLDASIVASGTAGDTAQDYSWAMKCGIMNMINSATIEYNSSNCVQQSSYLNVFKSFELMTSYCPSDVTNNSYDNWFIPDTAGSWGYQPPVSGSTLDPLNANGMGTVDPAQLNRVGYTGVTAQQGGGISNNVNAPGAYSGACTFGAFNSTGASPGAGAPPVPVPLAVGALDEVVQNGVGQVANGVAGRAGYSFSIDATAGKFAGSTVTEIKYGGASNPSTFLNGPQSYNKGMLERQQIWAQDVQPPVAGYGSGQTLVNATSSYSTCLRSGKVSQVAGSVTWHIYGRLKLKELADVFGKLPSLLKGSTVRMYLNTNQALVNFTVKTGGITSLTGAPFASPVICNTSVSVIGGLTCPVMLSSAQWGSGASSLASDDYQLSVSIYKNNFQSQLRSAQAPPTGITACRLYCPVYQMSPLAESKYLSLAPTKRVTYRDVFSYQFLNNVIAGGQFSFLVTNGIQSLKSVLVVPFVSKTQGAVQLPFTAPLSPYSSAPAMPDPIMLSNFNIIVSGVNLFLNNEMYDWEAWSQQLASRGLNGGLTTGLGSGLITKDDFARGRRYYYGDCSRTFASDAGVSRSVQIQGTNASLVGVDLFVYCEFEREIVIDLTSGARIG